MTEVIINLDRKMPARFGRDILVKLRAEKFRKRISNNYFGVRDKE
jgi:hypothetical protein